MNGKFESCARSVAAELGSGHGLSAGSIKSGHNNLAMRFSGFCLKHDFFDHSGLILHGRKEWTKRVLISLRPLIFISENLGMVIF